MDMRIDQIAQREAALVQELDVLLRLQRGVDDRCFLGLPGCDQVGRATQALIEELLEVHGFASLQCLALPPPRTTRPRRSPDMPVTLPHTAYNHPGDDHSRTRCP